MSTHPVRLNIETSVERQRIHVVIRLLLLMALSAIGCSSLYWVLYLALPAVAALLIASKGADRYLAEDGPPIVRALRWLAGAYSYLWLLTDAFPTSDGRSDLDFDVETGGAPTTGSALLRLIYSLPALLLLVLLSCVAGILWLVGAIAILVAARLPHGIAAFLELTLRYQFRLVAYHLSIVDCYPAFESGTAAPVPHSGAV
jgi:hypothetical protein